MTKELRNTLGEFLTGAQFFDCRALEPLLNERAKHDPGEYIHEMFEAELPAKNTCLEMFEGWIIVIADHRKTLGKFRVLLCGQINGPVEMFEFTVESDGAITPIGDFRDGFNDQQKTGLLERIDNFLRCAWFSIEAMQTAGGLCHSVCHNPSRQQKRLEKRNSTPCHRWVEIRLGKDRHSTINLNGTSSGRTVAWHYRRGHKVNHPNPNYPKWRKGTWVGDPQAGIRSHTYVLERRVPSETP